MEKGPEVGENIKGDEIKDLRSLSNGDARALILEVILKGVVIIFETLKAVKMMRGIACSE